MLAGCELACVDKFGRPLVVGVQVVRRCTILERACATARCKVNFGKISGLGGVKGALGGVQFANSLNWLDERGEFLV